MENISNGPDGI